MAQKFSMGLFGGLDFAQGILLGFIWSPRDLLGVLSFAPIR